MIKRLAFCLICAFSGLAFAQNDMHANVNLQFRFANPGARAQAMGGAFIGLADDSTALFANPAGLTQLSSSTLGLELTYTDRDNNIPFYGGEIIQNGLQDFSFNLQERNFPEKTTTVPYFGYVGTGTKLKWGVFYNEQANFQREFDIAGVAVPPYFGPVYVDRFQLIFFAPGHHAIDLKMRSLGGSIAGNLGEKFAWGLTLTYNDFQYKGNTTLLVPDFEALFPDINFDPDQIEALRPFIGQPFGIIDVDGDDQALGIYGGVLYTPTDTFSVGLSFKQQPEFDYDWQTQAAGDDFVLDAPVTGSGPFNVPDNYGVGFSFRPSDTFIISVEVNRVLYSELSDDFTRFFENTEDTSGEGQKVADTTEYRAGVEWYYLGGRYPVAFRMGYWFEPYHALQNTNLDTQILFRFLDEDSGDYLPGFRQSVFLQRFEEDQNHITGGLGLTFNRHFVMDLFVDWSDRTTVAGLSGQYRF